MSGHDHDDHADGDHSHLDAMDLRVRALHTVLEQKGCIALGHARLDARHRAAQRTPHGAPIELHAQDFPRA